MSAGANAPRATRDSDSAVRYHDIRFTHDPRRAVVWRAIANYLKPWTEPNGSALELGAGYGEFIQSIPAARKWALI